MEKELYPQNRRSGTRPITSCLWFDEGGLHIGNEYFLGHPIAPAHDTATVTKLEVLLSLAFCKRLTEVELRSLDTAAEVSRKGDQGLANIKLAINRIVRLPDGDTIADRLTMADWLLAKGMRPADLLRELDFAGSADLAKQYNRDEPRIPEGNGRQSGRFGSIGDVVTATTTALVSAAAVAELAIARNAPKLSFLSPEIGVGALESLAAMGAAISGGILFDAVFVPSPNSTSISGPVPGDDKLAFEYDHDEGVLRFKDETGAIIAAGQRDKASIFHDADTGIPFARALDGSFVFDSAALASADDEASTKPTSGAKAKTDADTDTSKPKLCPDPIAEPDNKASARSRAYQEQISLEVNGAFALKYGWAPAFFNPVTGKWVRPDDCDHQDGSLIEAKGPGYANKINHPTIRAKIAERFLRQAMSQIEVARGRRVRWYFAEQKTADFARKIFEGNSRTQGRVEIYVREALMKWI